MDTKILRAKAHSLKPIIKIGKGGVTDTVVQEIVKNLKVHKLIKVKLLQSCLTDNDKKAVAQEIATKTKSVLVQMTGFVIVLYKR